MIFSEKQRSDIMTADSDCYVRNGDITATHVTQYKGRDYE